MSKSTTEKQDRQVVILHIDAEAYGVGVEEVEAVIVTPTITPIPSSATGILGVINLRGSIVPVLDLRTLLGLPEPTESENQRTRTVIVKLEGVVAGLVVDAVSEVLSLREDSIDLPAGLVSARVSECVTGLVRTAGNRDGRLIILLDLEKVLGLCLSEEVKVEAA